MRVTGSTSLPATEARSGGLGGDSRIRLGGVQSRDLGLRRPSVRAARRQPLIIGVKRRRRRHRASGGGASVAVVDPSLPQPRVSGGSVTNAVPSIEECLECPEVRCNRIPNAARCERRCDLHHAAPRAGPGWSGVSPHRYPRTRRSAFPRTVQVHHGWRRVGPVRTRLPEASPHFSWEETEPDGTLSRRA